MVSMVTPRYILTSEDLELKSTDKREHAVSDFPNNVLPQPLLLVLLKKKHAWMYSLVKSCWPRHGALWGQPESVSLHSGSLLNVGKGTTGPWGGSRQTEWLNLLKQNKTKHILRPNPEKRAEVLGPSVIKYHSKVCTLKIGVYNWCSLDSQGHCCGVSDERPMQKSYQWIFSGICSRAELSCSKANPPCHSWAGLRGVQARISCLRIKVRR